VSANPELVSFSNYCPARAFPNSPFSHLLLRLLPPGAPASFPFFADDVEEFSSLKAFFPKAPKRCLFFGCTRIAGILIGIGPVKFDVAFVEGCFCRAGSRGAVEDRVDAMRAARAGEGDVSSGIAFVKSN
jgi:hypothetical protein